MPIYVAPRGTWNPDNVNDYISTRDEHIVGSYVHACPVAARPPARVRDALLHNVVIG